MHAPRRSELRTTDPDLACEMISTAYADNRLRVHGPLSHFTFEQSRVDLGDVRLDTYATTLTTEYHLDPFRHVLVARVMGGKIDNATAGVSRRLGPGDVYLPARADSAHFTRLRGARVELTSLELPLLRATDPERAEHRLARFQLDPLSPTTARRWQHSLDYVTRLVSGPDADLISPLVLGAAGRLLAAAALDAFAPDADVDPRDARRDATPAALARAIAFVDANLDLDIGPADIARASHVGVRALQLAFRRHRGTTPMGYVREARLERAHADLVAADPATGVTVGRIAARWGFSNATRFSAQYRAAFGRPPSATLHS